MGSYLWVALDRQEAATKRRETAYSVHATIT